MGSKEDMGLMEASTNDLLVAVCDACTRCCPGTRHKRINGEPIAKDSQRGTLLGYVV